MKKWNKNYFSQEIILILNVSSTPFLCIQHSCYAPFEEVGVYCFANIIAQGSSDMVQWLVMTSR